MKWALQAGLGPYLYAAAREVIDEFPREIGATLLSSDLTARVVNGSFADVASELVAMCARIGVPVTLLKGISIGEQCYPQAHFRPLTDIDLLVPGEFAALVETEARKLGYHPQGPPVMGPHAHHGEPLYHPLLNRKVEIHTSLFQQDSVYRQGSLFNPSNIARHMRPSQLGQWPVGRLSAELQLVYVASYLTRDLTCNSIHPSFVTPIMDMVVLLRSSNSTFDWDDLLTMLDNEMAAASLYLLLSYLARYELAQVPVGVVDSVRRRQNVLDEKSARLLRGLIHGWLIAGRKFKLFNSYHVWLSLLEPSPSVTKLLRLPWRVAFPPGDPHRFSISHQAARISRKLRGAE